MQNYTHLFKVILHVCTGRRERTKIKMEEKKLSDLRFADVAKRTAGVKDLEQQFNIVNKESLKMGGGRGMDDKDSEGQRKLEDSGEATSYSKRTG